VRVDRLIEHTTVLKRLFADGPLTFAGEHYRIGELDGTPKPYRPGGPPIIIAGGGRRVLRFAGATADIVGVNASIHSGVADAAAGRDGLPASIDQKISWLREGAGDRFEDLEINAWLSVAEVTDDGRSIADRLGSRFGADPADVLASPLILVGSEPEIVDRLHARRDRWGYSYFVVQGHKVHEFASIVARLTGA
jgi:alkanesulfonate monooxygenase SsuD/methylene tetrahydromethanopterin reductase-like flavin-dependent oxidoreductase (luciferase family)